jgi:hypothetical protein
VLQVTIILVLIHIDVTISGEEMMQVGLMDKIVLLIMVVMIGKQEMIMLGEALLALTRPDNDLVLKVGTFHQHSTGSNCIKYGVITGDDDVMIRRCRWGVL